MLFVTIRSALCIRKPSLSMQWVWDRFHGAFWNQLGPVLWRSLCVDCLNEWAFCAMHSTRSVHERLLSFVWLSCRHPFNSLWIESTSRKMLATGEMPSLALCLIDMPSCLLFTGTSAGELFVFELNSLSSTQLTNKVHHRIRLDCSHITTLHIAPPSHFLVGDDCGDVFSIHLSLSFVWLLKHSIHSSTITRLTRLVLP